LNIAFLLVQPLLIGLLIGWVADKLALRMFLCIVATMWFGCSNGAQQIVGELPIFRRERVSGQGLNAYILSKLGFLSTVSLALSRFAFVCHARFCKHFSSGRSRCSEHRERIWRAACADELLTGAAGAEGDFSAVDGDETAANASTDIAAGTSRRKKTVASNPLVLGSLMKLAEFFQVTKCSETPGRAF
jgi:hypothetical protein